MRQQLIRTGVGRIGQKKEKLGVSGTVVRKLGYQGNDFRAVTRTDIGTWMGTQASRRVSIGSAPGEGEWKSKTTAIDKSKDAAFT